MELVQVPQYTKKFIRSEKNYQLNDNVIISLMKLRQNIIEDSVCLYKLLPNNTIHDTFNVSKHIHLQLHAIQKQEFAFTMLLHQMGHCTTMQLEQ